MFKPYLQGAKLRQDVDFTPHRHAWTTVPRMSSPELGSPYTCDTIPHLMPWDNSETSRQLLWLLRDTNHAEDANIQVKVWQSFTRPRQRCAMPPFNAPRSPVTPLLLVIAWYCTVLPCAPSRRQPQSPHTAQQAAAAVARASVRGHGWDFWSWMNTVSNFGSSSRSSLIASFRSAAAGDENRAPWVLAPG